MFSINIPISNKVIYMFLLVILMNKTKNDFFILKLDCKQVYTGTLIKTISLIPQLILYSYFSFYYKVEFKTNRNTCTCITNF